MSETAKFKINLRTGEIEISGSEEFVEARINSLDDVLGLINSQIAAPDPLDNAEKNSGVTSSSPTTSVSPSSDGMPETFGEWMHTFKDGINDLEKALITARFVQSQSEDNDFKTTEVNSSLKDHGIKLSNPSQTLKMLENKKYLFQTRKVGKLSYKRVSTDGQKHLDTLKREG